MNFDFKLLFVRLYEKSFDEEILRRAAEVGFYFTFALFPLLLFLVSIFGMVLNSAEGIREQLFSYLQQIMPGTAFDLVEKTLIEVAEASSGGTLTIGFFIALWSASAGIESVGNALNNVYKLKETRPWWRVKLAAIGLTLIIALFIFIALGIIFYGSQFLSFLLTTIGLPVPSPLTLQILSFIVAAIALLLTFTLIYSVCPNHASFTWKRIIPGSIVAILLWLLSSAAFRLYLQYFDFYAKTYGSLGAIIILMFWLYLTALVILIGGAINAILDEFTISEYDKRDAANDAKIQPGA